MLGDDGVTYLLFLKMAAETDTEQQLLKGFRWGDLLEKEEVKQLNFYRSLLLEFASQKASK